MPSSPSKSSPFHIKWAKIRAITGGKSRFQKQHLFMKGENLKIRSARENNLKDLSLDLPHDTFTVVTGLSGSGKSSLAFDTVYAEGQRRYIETFSPYTR